MVVYVMFMEWFKDIGYEVYLFDNEENEKVVQV